jgi:hypothetical protein
MKKVSGRIFGFWPSIYLLGPSQSELDSCWSGNIEQYENKSGKLQFIFECYGYQYAVDLRGDQNKINFQGRILCERELVGKAYFTLYKNTKGIVLLGNWVEDGDDYDCLVQIIF